MASRVACVAGCHAEADCPWRKSTPPTHMRCRSDRTKGGGPPYDAVMMFRVLVLQTPYTLSDDQTEYQLRDRLSFMRFVGLALHGKRRLGRLTGAIGERLIHSRCVWRRMGPKLCRKVRSFCWPVGGRLSNGWR